MKLRAALLALSMVGIFAVGATFEIFKIGNRSSRYQDELERSIEQRTHIRRVSTLLQEAEATQRGYLLTGSPAYEALFRAVQHKILVQLEQLPSSFAEADTQLERANTLVALVRERLNDLTSVLEEHGTAGKPGQATDESRADLAIDAMTRIRELTDQMITFEEEQIRRASRQVDEELGWSRTVILVLLASIVVLVSGVLGAGAIYLAHRGRAEARLREATQLAETASRAKSDFLASMSHEIRTPLTSILGYAELLLSEKLTKQQRQFVDRLQISCAGLLALVNDILDFSKIEAGEITLEQEPLSLSALVADVMSIVSVEARRKGIKLDEELDPALPERVVGDALRLRQILLNLLSNGVKFTEKGSVTLRAARDGSSPAGARIRFEVRDTGIGIGPEVREKLFHRFSQVDSSIQRRYGGTGLGLAISRRLVEIMGGEIGVESEEGRGSTFWFVVSLPEAASADAEATDDLVARTVPHGRILLVEDSPQNQDLVATVLRRDGHHVDIVGDGESALSALATATYDLILMDMQMPRMDGLTATRRIRQRGGPARDVPIIAMTANVLPEHLREFREAGASDHISKPFRRAALVEKVGHWLAPEPRAEDASPRAGADLPTHDPVTLAEARAIMGQEWITACMTRLKVTIGTLMASALDTRPDVAGIKRHAHQIVADAGQLGFPELSRRCSELERACAQEGDIDGALALACQAGRLAVTAIDGLLKEGEAR